MNNINKELITIILSVKGRQDFSKRWLEYMALIDCKYPIIVADGDADNYLKDLINDSKYEKLNISFFEYDQKIKFIDYYKMMKEAASMVHTPFMMLVDNDDFILPSGINKIVAFLSKNSEYISAGSQIKSISINNNSYDIYGRNFINHFYPEYQRTDEPMQDLKKQMYDSINYFQSTWYNVHKTEYAQKIFSEIVEQNFSDLTIYEMYFQLRLLSLGRIRHLNQFVHYIRQIGTSSSKDMVLTRDLISKDLPNDIRKLAMNISRAFSDKDSEALEKVILDSYEDYLSYYFSHNLLRYRFPNLYKFKRFVITNTLYETFVRFKSFFREKLAIRKIYSLYDDKSLKHIKYELQTLKKFLRKAD